jgi:hypothetical protein
MAERSLQKETGWTEKGGKLWEPEDIEGSYRPDDNDQNSVI